ncbi:unnamed protein product [Cylindrotheca closterium]|uniref:Peptidylprolyl isomerase n=1 Tax=Cylindrotheca closterium TaxID=2856 RepID=A0AAD2CFP0_9STRA|nr:unnamed protein product [Cylindrotheca closterium]
MMRTSTILLFLALFCTAEAQNNGTCNPIKDETSCSSAGCFFCPSSSKCRVAESNCPGGGGGNNGGGGGGTEEEEDNEEQMPIVSNGTCNPIKDQTACETQGCFFCDKQQCRVSEDRCPNASDEGTCNPIQDQAFCEEIGCFYCAEAMKCRVSEERCPAPDEDEETDADGDEPVGDGSVTNGLCNPIKAQGSCEESGCFFCTNKSKCRISEQRCPGFNGVANGLEDNIKCNPIRDATACEDAGCFFCEDKGLCRATEAKCPPGAGTAFGSSECKTFKGDETGCSDAGCFFCGGSSAQCRLDEAECPGQGRSSPCNGLEETGCSTSEDCLWCAEGNVCTSARGGTCASAGLPPGNLCKQYTTDADCTSGETSNCRWCPGNLKCKNAEDECDDGEEGIRGNPCKDQSTTDGCTGVEGCLWCEGNSKCKKAEDGCDDEDEDGDADEDVNVGAVDCTTLIFGPDCEAEASCLWCPDEQTCNAADIFLCGVASATVRMDIEYGSPAFKLKNEGLGESDPNAVEVALNYYFEVAEDGSEIPFSFVDVQNQGFKVSQSQGVFLGVLSRKATFSADIVGVGSMELIVYKILEDGTITTPSGEVFDVTEGDVKFNVNLSNWSFCDEDETGICADSGSAAYVDIAMTVKGSAEAPEQDEADGSIFDLGGGVPILLTNQVEIDGVIDAMPPGFPRVEQTPAEGAFFVFRFPRFANTLVYDPIVGSGTLIVIEDATLPPVTPPTDAPVTTPTNPPPVPAPTDAPATTPSVPSPVVAPTDAPATTPTDAPVVAPPTDAPVTTPTTTPVTAPTTAPPGGDSGANTLALLMPLAVCLAAFWSSIE